MGEKAYLRKRVEELVKELIKRCGACTKGQPGSRHCLLWDGHPGTCDDGTIHTAFPKVQATRGGIKYGVTIDDSQAFLGTTMEELTAMVADNTRATWALRQEIERLNNMKGPHGQPGEQEHGYGR